MKIERYQRTRFWVVYDHDGALIAVVVYKKGAQEIVRRMMGKEPEPTKPTRRKVEPAAVYTA